METKIEYKIVNSQTGYIYYVYSSDWTMDDLKNELKYYRELETKNLGPFVEGVGQSAINLVKVTSEIIL